MDQQNRTRGAHWGFLAFFVGLGLYHLATLAITAARSGRPSADPLELLDVGPLLLLAFLPTVLLGLPPVLGARRYGERFGVLPTARDVKVGLACGAVALVAGYLLNLLLLALYGTDRVSDGPLADLADNDDDTTLWLALAALVVVVATPLAEELLVRGALWNALEHHGVPRWVVLVLTAVVFAYLHGEPTRTVALVAQGVAIGWARRRTGRVGAAFVAHAVNNLAPALLLFTDS
ncbi:CPBP family intramembrane metalloprotease [Amycolatopsis bartoniae]|uniref:Membrane protein n=1 Tax=Amycolatopsis bartoniae TaxID=941986 RepID=A0A8H9ITQ4_9PSEU|nr:CPBP family intramembrane metalloprotease [Amycolatopsis bartoniae]GHF62919.1 membrane protein [Amycolatopsis bartoniae]